MFFKKKVISVNAPATGKMINPSDLNDPVFSASMLGYTVAIEPESSQVCSPVNGEITMIIDSLHAFCVKDKNGAEFLIHIGIDTVKLKGEGFKSLVKMGDTVKVGQPVIEVDFPKVAENGYETSVIMIFTNGINYKINEGEVGKPITSNTEAFSYALQ